MADASNTDGARSGGSGSGTDTASEAFRMQQMLLGARAKSEKEPFTDKLIRKVKRDPLIPIGFALIVGVLGRGLHALYVGNKAVSYRMMRYRVLFQVGTIAALVFGMYFRPNGADDPAVGKGTVVDKRFYLDSSIEFRRPGAAAGTIVSLEDIQNAEEVEE